MNQGNLRGRIIDDGRGFGYPGSTSEYQNALANLDPDEWKNIPVCVVAAFKQVVTEVMRLDKKSIEMVRTADDQKRKFMHQFKIVEKDLQRDREELLMEIEKVNQQGRQDFQTTRMDVDAALDKHRLRLDQFQTEVNNSLRGIETKLSNVEESGEVRNYINMVIEETEEKVTQLMNLAKETLHDRITSVINQNLVVPGLIGEYEKFSNVKEYIQKTHFENKNKIEELERIQGTIGRDVHKQTTAQFLTHFQNVDEQFKKINDNFDALDPQKQLQIIKDDIEFEQMEQKSQVEKVYRDLEQIQQQITDIITSQNVQIQQLTSSKQEEIKSLEDKIEQITQQIQKLEEKHRSLSIQSNKSAHLNDRRRRQNSSINDKSSIESNHGDLQADVESIKRKLKYLMKSSHTSKQLLPNNTSRSGVGRTTGQQSVPASPKAQNNKSLLDASISQDIDQFNSTNFNLIDIDEDCDNKNISAGKSSTTHPPTATPLPAPMPAIQHQPSISVSFYHGDEPSKNEIGAGSIAAGAAGGFDYNFIGQIQDDVESVKKQLGIKVNRLEKQVERMEKRFNFLQRQNTNMSNSSAGEMRGQFNQMKSVLKSGGLKSLQTSIKEKRPSILSKTEANSPEKSHIQSPVSISPTPMSPVKEIIVPQPNADFSQSNKEVDTKRESIRESMQGSIRAISEESNPNLPSQKLQNAVNSIAQSSFLVQVKDPLDQSPIDLQNQGRVTQSTNHAQWRKSLIPSQYENDFEQQSKIKTHLKSKAAMKNARYSVDLRNSFRMPPIVKQQQKMTPQMMNNLIPPLSKSQQGSVKMKAQAYAVEFEEINQIENN